MLRHPSQQHVQVYDTKSFKHEKTIQVKGLSDDTSFSGLTSCVTNNCLYVTDYHKDIVYKVELGANSRLLNWNVDRRPTGLSVNAASNLLVACTRACKIQEYTADGLLVRELCLQSYCSELRPLHAKQMSSDQFVISCWNGKQPPNAVCDVVEVDRLGRVVVSYTSQLQSTSQQKFDGSGHLAVDENNTRILVSDCKNHRIVILNRTSNCARELNVTSVVGGVRRPSCLHFDASKNRLFVGECREQCRVLVLDNVIWA